MPIVTAQAESAAPPRPEFLALGAFYKREIEPWLESREGRRRKARLPSHRSANFEDGIKGSIKGVPFEMVELFAIPFDAVDRFRPQPGRAES
jgi:hypothetical protein